MLAKSKEAFYPRNSPSISLSFTDLSNTIFKKTGIYYVPGTVLDVGNVTTNKKDIDSTLKGLSVGGGKTGIETMYNIPN